MLASRIRGIRVQFRVGSDFLAPILCGGNLPRLLVARSAVATFD
jgi:hypothetical protein